MIVRAVMFGFGTIAFSLQATAEDRLTPMLAYVPADAVGALPDGAMVDFVDFAALRVAAGHRFPLFERMGWEPIERALAPLSRLAGGPPLVATYLQYAMIHEFASTPHYLGFEWQDIDAAIGFYRLPDAVTVLIGNEALTDEAAVGGALTGRGYFAEDRAGYPFWWRMEDNAHDLINRDIEDPLRGHLGGSARAGLVDGAFITAANWPAIDRTLAAQGADAATLAADSDFAALARAINRPVGENGLLLQAVLFDGAVEADVLIESLAGPSATAAVIAELRQRLLPEDGDGGTPRYSAFALADRHEGDLAVGVIALVYRSEAGAATATRTVADAFATMDSFAAQRPFREILPGDVSSEVVALPDVGRHVALIRFSTELPAPEGPIERTRTPYYALVNMLYRMDLAPLMVTAGH